MYLKWIICSVPNRLKSKFSQAQEQWISIKGQSGFLGQIGGWNLNNPLQAGILSCWRDENSYQQFMEHIHNDIFQRSRQKETYIIIEVKLFEEAMSIPGSANFFSALSKGKILRVSDSIVFSGRTETFIQNQTAIWNPGLAQAGGMLGGICAQSIENPFEYLVVSIWANRQAHQSYLQKLFPQFKAEANLHNAIQRLEGWIIQLEKTWQIINRDL